MTPITEKIITRTPIKILGTFFLKKIFLCREYSKRIFVYQTKTKMHSITL